MDRIKNIILCLILIFAVIVNPDISADKKENRIFIDATGKKVKINYPIKRVISLSPSITEGIYLLDSDYCLVGVTEYCTYPPEAQKKKKVGNVINPDIETIVSLNPDLVFASKEINSPKTVNKLLSIGITVYVFGQRNSFNDICKEIAILGKILKKETLANSIITKAKSRIEQIRHKTKGLPKPKVFWQIGENPLFTASKNTFPDEMLRIAGGRNIVKSNIRYPRYSIEEVIKKNPDVILIVRMNNRINTLGKIWHRFPEINAVKNNKIFFLDDHSTCAPTPLTYVKTLEKIFFYLHPDEMKNEK